MVSSSLSQLGLIDKPSAKARFVSYYDGNLVGDVDTSKSTTETMFFLGYCLISWQSLK